eukprot:CAMPEP_0198646568 /NCGR_PEP_ID=MMETSP1467-20131203/2013_1 /TAXON_ID=1462469 /ORGANISM="unid. sp., Strain CCMP2135" /LENGTH=75 /DNA_ID=CAMNT_0044382117 /DNA_START=429 /DNA_END=653 /DNA_ORIENTATION=-
MVAGKYLESNSPLADFLEDNFRLCGGHFRCLFGSGGVDDDAASVAAFGFVRGFWSDDLISAVRDFAPDHMDSSLW